MLPNSYGLPFVYFLRRQHALRFVDQLHQVHTFGQVAHVMVFAFEVFERLYLFAYKVEHDDLCYSVFVVLHRNVVDCWIGVNGELWFNGVRLLRL